MAETTKEQGKAPVTPVSPSPGTPTAAAIEESLVRQQTGAVMFGQLPKELAFLGGFKVREAVGVVPAWKPTKPGDVLVGQVVQYKEHPHKTYDTDLVVITGPTGTFSVWLTTDLAMKIGKDMAGRNAVVAFRYEGYIDTPSGRKMHSYQVLEVLEAERG